MGDGALAGDADELQRGRYERGIEVPVREWEGGRLLRVSIAPYNEPADVDRLLGALAELT